MRFSGRLYFDHQASTPLSAAVLDRMIPYLSGSPGNPHSSEHSFGWEAANAVETAKQTLANLLGCDDDEIVFTSGATEANNLAIKGLPNGSRKKILSTKIEHKCVLEALFYMERQGFELVWLRTDEFGYVDLNDLSAQADERTALISIIGAHNEVGTLQPIASIAEIARSVGARVHFDLAQGPTAIDMKGLAQFADSISLSAHKFYGPMGIGCLYIRRDLQQGIEPLLHGGGQQGGIRSGTLPVSLCVGMAAAAEPYLNLPAAELERSELRRLNELLWSGIQNLACDVRLNGPKIQFRHPGNLNVSFLGLDAQDIIGCCQPLLAVSSGSACTSGFLEPSYVLTELGLPQEMVRSAIRFSIGQRTSEADVQDAVLILNSAIRRLTF